MKAKSKAIKVTVEIKIWARPGDTESICDGIREELTSIIEDECPTDLEGVVVHDLEEEDEE